MQQFMLLQKDQQTSTRGIVASGMIATYKALGGGWQIREGNDFISKPVKDSMGERTNWGDLLKPAAAEPVPADKRGSWRAPDR